MKIIIGRERYEGNFVLVDREIREIEEIVTFLKADGIDAELCIYEQTSGELDSGIWVPSFKEKYAVLYLLEKRYLRRELSESEKINALYEE